MILLLSLGIIGICVAFYVCRVVQKVKLTSLPSNSPLNAIEAERARNLVKTNKKAPIWPGINLIDHLEDLSIVEWLKSHGPDPELWHFISVFTNPGPTNIEIYAWLIDQAEFDAASAAYLFHSLEGWGMLSYVEGQKPYNETWDPKRFQVVKKIADKFERNGFVGPNYTLMRREDDAPPNAYQEMHKQSEYIFGEALFRIPNQIFEYGVRKRINPNFHYSNYHYNPFGEDIGTILELTDNQLTNLLNLY